VAKHYITTAIDYPNAAPHMGHVLEKVLADAVARWWRLCGHEVRFQIGTDEHGVKIQQTAAREGITPRALVDRNVPLFEELYARLQVSADVFIRTSDGPVRWEGEKVVHRPTVEALWCKLKEAGMLEQRTYAGLYCSGCERFVTAKDLIEGKCPDHQVVPEEVQEENWFFALSRERDWLQKLLTTGAGNERLEILPRFRGQETLSLLQQGLEDVSFSRPKKSLTWGIPVPGDPDQTMYVWCDALTNYISGLDYFGLNAGSSHAKPSIFEKDAPLRSSSSAGPTSLGEVWWNDATVTHVIGKDIARFHALLWPAMLKAAGIRPPDRLLMHGFITSEGQKMSKSLGNVVAPDAVIQQYGVDALRFFLVREIPVGNDGDFSWKRFGELYDSKLRNQLGNLLNRVLVLLHKEGGVLTKGKNEPPDYAAPWWKLYEEAMDSLSLHLALDPVDRWLTYGNGYMDSAKPWALRGRERSEALWHVAETMRQIALMLLPFIPTTAQSISLQLDVPYAEGMLAKEFVITDAMKQWGGLLEWKRVGEPAILFPKVEA
jgi:methionyl-tRNA synthetase